MLISFAFWLCLGDALYAIEPSAAVRDGLRLYWKDQFDEAREKFAAAGEELGQKKSAEAAIAAFDEACAYHRKGDIEHARDCYLRAGLSTDISISTASHFNLGNLSAEQARTLSGEKPATVPADKRKEILDHLSQAVAAYRHCLELNPEHTKSRHNLELVRKWIKYYSDQWREQDRQKRRDESNLLQFLEFVTQTQTALRETVARVQDTASPDAFAELKRAQDELSEEVPTLREKIAQELKPQSDPNSPTPQNNTKEIDEGIALLQGWADTAGQKMVASARHLSARNPTKAIVDQKTAIDELDKIWEAIVPFQPLLTKELSEQTLIANSLNPKSESDDAQAAGAGQNSKEHEMEAQVDTPDENSMDGKTTPHHRKEDAKLEVVDEDFRKLDELQTRTLSRARMLAPKAAAELDQLDKSPPPEAGTADDEPKDPTANFKEQKVDPEQLKQGLQKAIELAPRAVEQMESALKSIQHKDRVMAGQHAEEARKILVEIQQAQPKSEPQKNQQQDEKQQQDDKSGEEKKNDPKQGDDQQDEQQQSQNKQNKGEQNKEEEKKQQPQVSKDRIEDALRKVRERQQEKRERDKKAKGQYFGKTPVDKDW